MGTRGKRGVAPSRPQAKPNGDTNRSLLDIELALAKEFNWQQNLVVFNVNGLSGRLPIFHECDMLVMTKAGYLTEIEIKRSFDDFCNEFKKAHHHESHGPDIKEFWYCVPEGIFQKVIDKLSEKGWRPTVILTYNEDLTLRYKSVPDFHAAVRLYSDHPRPLSTEQQLELARLGAMRQVALRKKISVLLHRDPVTPDGKLLTKIAQMEILLHEYRKRFKEETGYALDEKEILFG